MKYGSFSRIIGLCNSLAQNYQNLCSKCALHTDKGATGWRAIDNDATDW